MKPNITRNREIVERRIKDQITWSFGKLGEHYNLHKTTVEEIFNRDLEKYANANEIKAYIKLLKDRR